MDDKKFLTATPKQIQCCHGERFSDMTPISPKFPVTLPYKQTKKATKRVNVMNQKPSSQKKKRRNSFELLDSDLTVHKLEHINQIFLLNRSKVPDGQPTGVDYELFTEENYPDLAEAELDDRLLPYLIRHCALNQLNFFRDMKRIFDRDGYFTHKGRVLRGSAGAGKSYVLYYIVQFCRASGWLVLYVPTAGDLAKYNNEKAAHTLLENFLEAEQEKLKDIRVGDNKPSLYDFISDGLENEKYFDTLDALFNIFAGKRLKYPVLVAVDEWNVKFEESKSCPELLDLFALQKLRSGFWLYAVSSSFDPISGFQSADKQTLSVKIARYNKEEFDAILNCQQHYKRLPKNISDKEIQSHSGNMPRMIFFWCQASRGHLDNPFKLILENFYEEAESYYRQRIHKTLERADKSSTAERNLIYNIAAQVCLNVPVWNLPPLWSISGLFVKSRIDDGAPFYSCVCPPVSNAFIRHLWESSNQILKVLSADSETHGRAFELLVTLRFHTYSKTIIDLPNKDLTGKERNTKRLTIIITWVIKQSETLADEPLSPGTLLILRKGHRVLDLVIYSENFDLYLIQISVSSYMDHDKKVTNLNDDYNGNTVLEHYMSLCEKSPGIPQFPKFAPEDLDCLDKKLPAGVYYVYITTSKSQVRKTTGASSHPVIWVGPNDLGNVLGSLWESHKEALLA